MARMKYIIGNWKMNMTVDQAVLYVNRIEKEIKPHKDVEVVICPGTVCLHPLSKLVNTKKIKLGIQNFYYADSGTFTGETSATQVKEMVEYGIVGHSDRRRKFYEQDDEIARKMTAALRNNITPILCVGEDLIQRQDGLTDVIIQDQLTTALSMITAEDISQILIAYEPIWSISSGDGQGENAKPEPVRKAIATIRDTIRSLYGKKAEESLHVLYGGSSNPDNTVGYLQIRGVDGLLSGGASLNYKSFAQMIEKAGKV